MEEMCTMTDEKLVKLYSQGNNEAFDVLIERHKDKLYAYIFHAVKDADVANDIFQETCFIFASAFICNIIFF